MRGLAALRPLASSIRRSDPWLAEQLTRAATHLALEIFNAEQWRPRSKRRHWVAALASASETLVLVRMAVDAGYCTGKRSRGCYAELHCAYLELLKRLGAKHRGGR